MAGGFSECGKDNIPTATGKGNFCAKRVNSVDVTLCIHLGQAVLTPPTQAYRPDQSAGSTGRTGR